MPEALDVLKTIRELRKKDQSKVHIMELLAKKGFPLTVEEAVEDIERIISGSDPRDTLLTVMQTTGQVLVKIGDQDGRINRVETRVEEQSERIDGQDGRILNVEEKQDEQAELVDELCVELSKRRNDLLGLRQQRRQLKNRPTNLYGKGY